MVPAHLARAVDEYYFKYTESIKNKHTDDTINQKLSNCSLPCKIPIKISTGTPGNITLSSYNFTFISFNYSLLSSNFTINRNSTGNNTITVIATVPGIYQNVTVTIGSLPSGINLTSGKNKSCSPIDGSCNLTFTYFANSSTSLGPVIINLNGTSSGVAVKKSNFSLTVYPLGGLNSHHQADMNNDSTVDINELTVYNSFFKRAIQWPTQPRDIDINYYTRAIFLFKKGETYTFNSSLICPLCWINYSSIGVSSISNISKNYLTSDITIQGASTSAFRTLPSTYTPNQSLLVNISLNFDPADCGSAIVENLPAGWDIFNTSSISNLGVYNSTLSRITWADNINSISCGGQSDNYLLKYTITPNSSQSGPKTFTSAFSVDGVSYDVQGDKIISDKLIPSLIISISPNNTIVQGQIANITGTGCPIGVNCTLTKNGELVNNPDIQNLNAGTYEYIYNTSGDSVYDSASVSDILTINTPPITIFSPIGNYDHTDNVALNFSLIDYNDKTCWYHTENGLNLTLDNCENTTFNISEGNHILSVYTSDSSGNIEASSTNFSIILNHQDSSNQNNNPGGSSSRRFISSKINASQSVNLSTQNKTEVDSNKTPTPQTSPDSSTSSEDNPESFNGLSGRAISDFLSEIGKSNGGKVAIILIFLSITLIAYIIVRLVKNYRLNSLMYGNLN